MADSKEQLKRKNYFDLKRDEFMAMDEYLQSPMEDADNLKILGMKLMLQEAADSLDDLDRIDKLSPSEIIIEFENLIGKKGA